MDYIDRIYYDFASNSFKVDQMVASHFPETGVIFIPYEANDNNLYSDYVR